MIYGKELTQKMEKIEKILEEYKEKGKELNELRQIDFELTVKEVEGIYQEFGTMLEDLLDHLEGLKTW